MGKYVAAMMVISWFVDILILAGTGRLAARRLQWSRGWLAALVGAAYKSLCLLPPLHFMNHMILRVCVMALLGIIAFGCRRGAMRAVVTFMVLQMALSGLVAGIGETRILPCLLGGIALWLLCAFGCRELGGRIIPAELTNRGRTVQIRALVDTGNMLKDPVTGESVLIVCNKLGIILAGLTESQIADPIQTLLENPHIGLRLLPYHTVGQKNGMMLAMKIDKIKLMGENAGNLIAFAPCGLSMQKEYQALTGGI